LDQEDWEVPQEDTGKWWKSQGNMTELGHVWHVWAPVEQGTEFVKMAGRGAVGIFSDSEMLLSHTGAGVFSSPE
jgi:hypothetical protein